MKKINKYLVTSSFFILIILYAGIRIVWGNAGEIKDIVLANVPIKDKIKLVEEVYKKLPNDRSLLNIYSIEQSLIGTSLYEDAEYGAQQRAGFGLSHGCLRSGDAKSIAQSAAPCKRLDD